MLASLRRKFIAIIMSIVTVIMAVSFSFICASKYQADVATVDAALTAAANSAAGPGYGNQLFADFVLPSMSFGDSDDLFDSMVERKGIVFDNGMPRAKDDSGTSTSDDGEQQRKRDDEAPGVKIGKQGATDASTLIPVAVYRVDSLESISLVSKATTATISDAVAEEAVAQLLDVEDGHGSIPSLGLSYYKTTSESGRAVMSFTDSSYIDSWYSLALTLFLVGLGALAVLFIVCLFLSRWALRPVEEAWNSQRQFIADASHDLKTPLTVILANMSILLQHPSHTIASESQWLENTKSEAENMQNLVNEMLELAKVESPQQRGLISEDIDFSDMVDGATLMFDVMALERGCEFDCDVEGGLHVKGEPAQLDKMVKTLLENAFKYVDDGGKVSVRLHRASKNLLLSITNTGRPIDPQDLPHIFDRFYRADKARTSGKGGFGLGLAISREVARSHGGDIACRSNESGTVFEVSLPILEN